MENTTTVQIRHLLRTVDVAGKLKKEAPVEKEIKEFMDGSLDLLYAATEGGQWEKNKTSQYSITIDNKEIHPTEIAAVLTAFPAIADEVNVLNMSIIEKGTLVPLSTAIIKANFNEDKGHDSVSSQRHNLDGFTDDKVVTVLGMSVLRIAKNLEK